MPQRPKRLTPSSGPLDLFGSEVRRYRQLAELSLAQLADKIPFAASTIGEVERGETGCDRVFAEECDRVLDTREALAHLHDGLFDGRSAAFPKWFEDWPDVELQAEVLRIYEPIVVTGLLQTPSIAEILLYGDQAKVAGRLERQAILLREEPPPPRVVYVLPERVLRSRTGSAEVMREQLLHLADAVSPSVSVQVIPDGEPHPGNSGAFMIATLPSGEQAAYTEGEPHGIMRDSRSDLEKLNRRFTDISTYALPASMSVALIREIAEEAWKP
ncbi:helix-turn-helix domain-containing protein [Actinomadura chibensis]|uniref:Helix-turn-helix domain-containing protein n=1 Tax=Actinomadura chibensis TaxID=392828 RepID=A0A5D0NX44_9ACTN|nr:helix-turn-helix transcriptional regulator [Actinomadura chibensis]TYB49243.1 helix-turn-helix domain-containing protein [Actinomadura chibensis]